mmetsp:Transcript_24909/g.54329  ORF Transcript_24909/g.54329 Transcript_24909/m.54329 type:complete len:159 (-) Transcript_24909:244-720(-)
MFPASRIIVRHVSSSSSSSSTKIPPHVAAELRRHVSPKKRPPSASPGAGGGEERKGWSKGATLAACCAFTAAAGSIPYFVMMHFRPLNEREEALTHAQIRRGAFMNSGSRDVGKDPKWDFKTGTFIKDQAYVELFEKDEGPGVIDHDDRIVASAVRKR